MEHTGEDTVLKSCHHSFTRMSTILEKEYSIVIYRTSYLSLVTLSYALYRKSRMAIFPGTVFLTSINYWRNPTNSWRRFIDINAVVLSLLYHLYVSWYAEYGTQYYIVCSVAAAFYPIGYYYHNKKDYWSSTYSHVLLHIVANLANIILYSGTV